MQQIRIQKVLSDHGILSRRKAEQAILAGRIRVNGHPCLLGQKVDPARDVITVDGDRIRLEKQSKKITIMLHKPRGVLTTTSDDRGRRSVMELLEGVPAKVYPIGRLDKDSEGLLLLTNDGALANDIMHPAGGVPKTYRATVRPTITEEQILRLSTGVMLDNKMTLPAAVHVQSKEPDRAVVQITVREGRNRQIRRMCEAVGLSVARLRRIAIGPVKLGMLPPGQWRELKPSELIALRGSIKKRGER